MTKIMTMLCAGALAGAAWGFSTSVAWKWDESGRTVVRPAAVSGSNAAAFELRRAAALGMAWAAFPLLEARLGSEVYLDGLDLSTFPCGTLLLLR